MLFVCLGAVALLDHVTPPSVLPWISTSPPALNVPFANSESFHAARVAAVPRPRTSPPASAASTLRRGRGGGGEGEWAGRQCREYFAAAARRVGISFALPVGLGFCCQFRAWSVNAQGGFGHGFLRRDPLLPRVSAGQSREGFSVRCERRP